jgi:hypothetical protein
MLPDTYPTLVAAKLGGATRQVLNNWHIKGMLMPAVPGTNVRGLGHLYSFADVVAMRALRALKPLAPKDQQAMRALVAYLCARPGLSPTIRPPATVVATDGVQVYELAATATLATMHKHFGPKASALACVSLGVLVTDLQAAVRALYGKQQHAA